MRRKPPAGVLALVVAIACLLSPRALILAQQPTLSDVLAKAATALEPFLDPSRVIACQEQWTLTISRIIMSDRIETSKVGDRRWVADLAIIATPGDEKLGFPWMEFHDILSVDKKTVREAMSRLGILATEPLESAGPKALTITRDSAGVRLGGLSRAGVLPRLATVFLYSANQPRFELKKGGEKTIEGVRTWEVRYKERAAPTIIGGTNGKDAPSSGSFWVDPATGRVLMSVLKNGDSSSLYVEVTVTYGLDTATGLWVPTRLKERLVDDDERTRVEGTATFTEWRIVPRKTS